MASSKGEIYESLLHRAAGTYPDSRSLERRMAYLKEKLFESIVQVLMGLLYQEVEKNCDGCKIAHPSQIRHSCLFLTQPEWVNLYGDSVLKKLNVHQVMEDWYPEINAMHLSRGETAQVYQLWESIKEDFDTKTTDREWTQFWKQRMLRTY